MSSYHIYQTKADYVFRSWDEVKDKFKIDDYKKVYSGELIDSITYNGKTNSCNTDDFKVLNDLFRIFNIKRPEDYKARSLSVSDVIAIVREETTKYYYFDDYGWKLIPNEIISKEKEI